jgi:hypothetical protein
VEDAWLKVAEGVGMGQCMQGVILLPSSVVVPLLEFGQLLGQVSNSIVHLSEVLHFCVEGFILLLVEGEVDHGGEGLPGIEGICLLSGEDPLWVWVFPHLEGA